MNTLKKEREQRLPDDKYPWLDPDDEQRHMTDGEILEKIHWLGQFMSKWRRKERSYEYVTWLQGSI